MDTESKKRKERVKKTVAKVLGRAPIMVEEEEEEEAAAPAPKAPKVMGDAIRSGGAASKPKEAPKAASKPKTAPKRNTRSIPTAEKNKAPVPETVAEEEEELCFKKLCFFVWFVRSEGNVYVFLQRPVFVA